MQTSNRVAADAPTPGLGSPERCRFQRPGPKSFTLRGAEETLTWNYHPDNGLWPNITDQDN
jgi:hypothetical protein